MSIQAMKQALAALESPTEAEIDRQVIDDLRAAITEAERQEPVAVMWPTNIDGINAFAFTSAAILYTTPQSEYGVVITTDESGRCVAVTRQDEEGHIKKVLWEAPTPQPAISDGWQLVPVEPTPEMIKQGNAGFASSDSTRHTVAGCYKAMLAAAPKPEEMTITRATQE